MHERRPPGSLGASDSFAQLVERQLVSLETQLEQLRAQIRQAQQLSSLGAAAATFAHEISNHLQPVASYAEAALESGDTGLMNKALRVTAQKTRLLVNMSERLLEISAARPSTMQSVNVRAAAEDAVEALCRDLSKDGIRLVVEIDNALHVWFDPLQLMQVLFNLLLNAREAMSKRHSGRLSIGARREDDAVVIEVSDTGCGIPPEVLPHVFDPLQSTRQADRNGKSRCGGLGLALCRDLVEGGGGNISVRSTVGEGTTFAFRLPVRPTTV